MKTVRTLIVLTATIFLFGTSLQANTTTSVNSVSHDGVDSPNQEAINLSLKTQLTRKRDRLSLLI